MKLSERWVGVWAVFIWSSAPLLPALRSYLNESAPGGFDRYVAAGLLTVAVGVIGLVCVRQGDDRWQALGKLALVLACFAALYALLASPDPRSNLVELAHFVEYGTLAVLAFASLGRLSPPARWAQTLLLVVAVGVVDEAIQWALASRVAEIRDVALNAAAGGLALCYTGWVLRVADDEHSPRLTRGEMRQIATVGALLLPALVAFLYVVHLGYWIRWDDIEFVSQYRASEIERVGEDRRARWASWPEVEENDLQRPVAKLWTLEDFYATEARRHIQARNEAADGGELHLATGENLIVERWYSPYLEVAGAARADLPVELSGPYRSLVLAHLWPELGSQTVWGAFIAAELALVGLAVYLGRLERRV